MNLSMKSLAIPTTKKKKKNDKSFPIKRYLFNIFFRLTAKKASDMHIIVPLWGEPTGAFCAHYGDVIMGTIASQITSLTIVYSTIYSDANQRKHQSSASLAFVRGSHRGPVNSPHKWPVTRKMFPFDDVIMRKHQRHGKRFHVMTSSRWKEFPSQALYRKMWTQQFASSSIEWWCPVTKKLSKITIIKLVFPLTAIATHFVWGVRDIIICYMERRFVFNECQPLLVRQNTRH